MRLENILAAALIAASAAPARGAGVWAPPSSAERDMIQGSVSTRFRNRRRAGFSDNDLSSYLSLDYGTIHADRVSASLQAGGTADLDPNRRHSPLNGVRDAFGSRAYGRVYHAHVSVKGVGPLDYARVGRQTRFEFESLYFDGAYLESRPFRRFRASVLAGVPTHPFETMSGVSRGDWLAGGALQHDARFGLRTRLDFVHLRDASSGFRSGIGHQEDDLAGLSFWGRVGRRFSWSGRLTSFSDRVRDLRASASASWPEERTILRMSARRLLNRYDIRVAQFDAFRTIGSYEPYTEFDLRLTRMIREVFSLEAGAGLRALDSEQGAGSYNHGYRRIYLSGTVIDFLNEGLSLTASGDAYQGTDHTLKNNNFGSSLTASQKLRGGDFVMSGGTAYYLFRQNFYTAEETNEVQVYFMRLKGKIRGPLEGSLRVELEDNPFGTFQRIDIAGTWRL